MARHPLGRGQVADHVALAVDKVAAVNELRGWIHELSPMNGMPVDYVRWVHIDDVVANDYNPNTVAPIELGLLLKSIEHDGYTQPVVTVYDVDLGKYVIVDGFHRYFVMKRNQELFDRTNGYLPCVVIDKSVNERMAATIRHNRARGKHSVEGMSSMVFQMLDNGMSDAEVCNELGLEPEELLRLKHVTGFSKLFADHEYSRAWMTRAQVRQREVESAAQAQRELQRQEKELEEW